MLLKLYSPAQAAKRLGEPRRSVYYYLMMGRLEAWKVRHLWRIPESSLSAIKEYAELLPLPIKEENHDKTINQNSTQNQLAFDFDCA